MSRNSLLEAGAKSEGEVTEVESSCSNNMVVNNTQIYQNMKNKSLLSIEKILKNEKKCTIVIIQDYCFEKIMT